MNQTQWRIGDAHHNISVDDLPQDADAAAESARLDAIAEKHGLRLKAATAPYEYDPMTELSEETAPHGPDLLDSMRLVVNPSTDWWVRVLYQPKLCGIPVIYDVCRDPTVNVVRSRTPEFERQAPMRSFVPLKASYSVRPCAAAPTAGAGTVAGLVQAAIDQVAAGTARTMARALYLGAQDGDAPGTSWEHYLTLPFDIADGSGAIDITPVAASVPVPTSACYGINILDAEIAAISTEGGSIFVGSDVFAQFGDMWQLTKVGRRWYTKLGNLIVIDPGFDGRAPGGLTVPLRSDKLRYVYATGGRPSGIASPIYSPNVAATGNEARYLGNAIADSTVVMDALGRPTNDFEAVAHRRFAVTYGDCAHFAIQVDTSLDC